MVTVVVAVAVDIIFYFALVVHDKIIALLVMSLLRIIINIILMIS